MSMNSGWKRGALATLTAAVCSLCWGTTSIAAPNDDFRDAYLLEGSSGSDARVSGLVYASVEPGEPAHARRGPYRSLWWRYRPAANGWLTLDTHGSRANTVLGLYTGAAVDQLRGVASNDDDGSPLGNSGLYEIPVIGSVLYRIAVASRNATQGFGYGYGYGYLLNWRYLPARGGISYRSAAALDGSVLESTEASSRGGSLDAAGSLLVGDDARDRQYRSLLSFDTGSIPDRAVIVSARLKLKLQRVAGKSPFSSHGPLLVDIGKPRFGVSGLLQLDDFAAPAGLAGAGTVGRTAVGGFYVSRLKSTALRWINKGGVTQLRLRHEKGDNDDRGADFSAFFSGNAPLAYRPVLEVRYTSP